MSHDYLRCNVEGCEACRDYYRGVRLGETMQDPDALGSSGLGVLIAPGVVLDGLKAIRGMVRAKTGEEWDLSQCVAIAVAIAQGTLERGEI